MKLDTRLDSGGAFFSVTGHSVSDLLTFFCEKAFRNRGSGFLGWDFLENQLMKNL